MSLKEIRTKLEQRKGQQQQLLIDKEDVDDTIETLDKEIKYSEQAQIIIQTVAKQTQQELEYHISDIVSMALDAIFDKPYRFKIKFVIKRNKTECELLFERNGEEFDPMEDSGGGVVQVAAFALRISLWTLQQPRSRNVIILDEPFTFLHNVDYISRAATLLKELSKKLNLQFIIVTDIKELTEEADKIFQVKLKKGISKIEIN